MNLNQTRMHLLFAGILLSIFVMGCGKPRIINPETAGQISCYTEGGNFERHNYCPVNLRWPLEIEEEESINGTTTLFPFIQGTTIFFTTRNGHLTSVPLTNLGKDRKTRLSKGSTASPTFCSGRAFIPMELGKYGLRVYNLYTGKIEWDLDGYHSSSAPVIIDNLIIHTGKYGEILGLDMTTGKRIWKTNIGSNIYVNSASDGNVVIAVSQDGLVQSIEPEFGLSNWTIELGESVYSQPMIIDNMAYLPTYNGNICRIDLLTGGIDIIYDFGINLYTSLSTDLRMLYIPLSDGRITGIDLTSASVQWETQLDGPVSVPLLVTNEYILAGTGQRNFYVIDKSDGRILQSLKLNGRLSSVPVIASQSVFIGYEYDHIALLRPEED